MKKTTRILSIVMAIIVAFTSLSVVAFAEEIEECEHDFRETVVAPTCAERGYTIYVCPLCGETFFYDYTPALGHSWGEWTNFDEATCTAEGHDERTCAVCKAVETKTLPVISHVDSDKNGKCDMCGIDMETKTEYILNPYDWFKAFFAYIRALIARIFA